MYAKLKTCITAICAIVIMAVGGVANAADCPIKLGGIVPLSAPGSVTSGEAQRDAMLIAVENINARGGVLDCNLKSGNQKD